MFTITCKADLIRVAGTLPVTFAEVIRNELDNLLLMLDSENNSLEFQIDSVGYRIVGLDHMEPETELERISLVEPFHQIEYIEIFEASTVHFYRILIMHDNECFTIALSPKETQNTGLEAWLREHCEQGRIEA
ncbi:MAG: hypothetical protein E6Y08_01945 [Paenibacillus sp.]|uniref:hypothetical protein n=1 Tax=Paenibacillus sp. TaxID=58172 RepID=UPI0029143B94|nr:hypothetical protein [Paenibacillus sp.]MDU4694552.1 hypothetical protein [Paenibacillus sp.]